jgi:copper-binding protein NosD
MRPIIDILLAIGLFIALEASAKIIEVSKSSDKFNTIQKAVDSALPGDVIKVHGGVYKETVVVKKENITIEAYDLKYEPVFLDGSASIPTGTAWSHVQGKIYKTTYKWPWKSLTDDEVTSWRIDPGKYFLGEKLTPLLQVFEDEELLRGYRNKKDPKYLKNTDRKYLTGAYKNLDELDPMQSRGSLPWNLSKPDIRIPGRFMYDDKINELYVWSAKEDTPGKHSYRIPTQPFIFLIQAKGVVLRNLVMSYSAICAVVMENSDNSIIENCFFINNNYSIYAKKTNGLRVRRNFIQTKGYWERYHYEDSKMTLLGNIQIYIDAKADFTSMKDCEIYENTMSGGGYLIIIFSQDSKIYRNILSHSTHLCISPRPYKTKNKNEKFNLQVFQNIFHHNDQLCIGFNGVNYGPLWFYRNIVYASWCFSKGGGGTFNDSSPKVFVYNNTMAFMGRIIGHWYKNSPVKKQHVYRNNIFHIKWSKLKGFDMARYFKRAAFENWQYFPFVSGPDFDYNLYCSPEPESQKIFEILTTQIKQTYRKEDFSRMIANLQIEQHGFQKDPMFQKREIFYSTAMSKLNLDAFSRMDYRIVMKLGYDKLFNENFEKLYKDFALSEESPAIGMGALLPSEWPDLNAGKNNKQDIGALEFHPLIINSKIIKENSDDKKN